MKRCRCLPSIF